jgi:F-type H+-transporting ATPase subunit alpha
MRGVLRLEHRVAKTFRASQARLNNAAQTAGDKNYRPLFCIYVAIGQKQSNIARIISMLEQAEAMRYTIIEPHRPPIPPQTNISRRLPVHPGEWFMDHGMMR